MKAFEQLLEAVEYSMEIEVSWTEQFSDLSEARNVLGKAEKQALDENEVASLAIAMGDDPPDTLEEVGRIKRRCFLKLRRELRSS